MLFPRPTADYYLSDTSTPSTAVLANIRIHVSIFNNDNYQDFEIAIKTSGKVVNGIRIQTGDIV